MEIDLYALTDKDGKLDNETLEAELGKIDNKGAAAIHKLERGTLLGLALTKVFIVVTRLRRSPPVS
jgi:hypothetical protein